MDGTTHDTPSETAAENGEVIVDGPEGVAVTLTPEAARRTGERLVKAAREAADQRAPCARR